MKDYSWKDYLKDAWQSFKEDTAFLFLAGMWGGIVIIFLLVMYAEHCRKMK